jgi:uncharacterized protein YndB with AHSA1/START domain
MATIAESFEFGAPAEVVFGVLTDPDRTTRWLPVGVTAESAGGGRLLVRAGERTTAYEVEVVPGDMRLSWRSSSDDGLHGTAEVRDAPAGGSVVHAEVAVPDEDRGRELLTETMAHLRRDVSDNFNAG